MGAATILTQIKEPVSIPVSEVVKKLRGYLHERQTAINMFPHAKGADEKLEAINEALDTLSQAAVQLNPKRAIIMILRIRLTLHFIAPHATKKLHHNWFAKVEQLMDGCREYLGWRAQA
jgi:hypothetical protein